jgi:hypothetical protein
MPEKHLSQLLEGLQSLPAQLIDPLIQVAQRGALVTISPQPVMERSPMCLHGRACPPRQARALGLLSMITTGMDGPTFSSRTIPSVAPFPQQAKRHI